MSRVDRSGLPILPLFDDELASHEGEGLVPAASLQEEGARGYGGPEAGGKRFLRP
jgi:hypothetical protein